MRKKTYLGNVVDVAGDKAQYDCEARKLVSDKTVDLSPNEKMDILQNEYGIETTVQINIMYPIRWTRQEKGIA